MRIAFIGQKGIPAHFGGIERHVEELSTRLAAAGNEVFVYGRPWYLKGREDEINSRKYKGVNLVILPSIKSKHLDAISHTFISTIHALFQSYDVIHYHGVGPSLLAWLGRVFRPSTKVVTTFHCIDRKHQKWGFFSRLALRLGEWCACRFTHQTIVVSKTLHEYCSQTYECEAVYIPNGVCLPDLSQKNERAAVLKKFGLESNKYLLMVSRLVRHKGAHYLIEAFNQISADYPDYKLAIVGGSAFTDDYVKSLKAMAAGNPKIVFTGYENGENLRDLFVNSYAVVHPSESEGLPIAVLEAMSYGKIVLASDILENLEVIDGGYGLSFHNKDINDLALKLRYVLEGPQEITRIGLKGRDRVAVEYDWNDIVKKTIAVYQNLITEKENNGLKFVTKKA